MIDGKNIRISFTLAKMFFRRSKSNFRFSVVAMIIGVWGVIIVASIINGFQNVLIDSITNFYPHIIVYGDYNENNEHIVDKIKFNLKSAAVFFQNQINFVQIMELDDVSFYKDFLVNGKLSEGVIVGKKMAESLNINIDDEILLISSTGFLPITQRVKIAGIFESGVATYDTSFLLVQNTSEKNYTGIFLKNSNMVDRFKSSYLKEYSAFTWEESNQTLAKAIQFDSLIAFLITFFIILISGFSISNSVSFSVFTRKKEIAILRALGLKKNNVAKIFILETFFISLIGYVGGVFFGILTSWTLNLIKIPLPQDLFYVDYLPLNITFASFFVAFVMNCSVSILFSFAAARRASNLNIVEILKEE